MSRMATAVRAALRGGSTTDPRDAAAERLALQYAALIDNAAPAAKYRRALATLHAVAATSDDPDVADALDVVQIALAEHSVASDLGPKLLATLQQLGLTTAGRGAARDGGKRGEPNNPIDELRARRAARGTG